MNLLLRPVTTEFLFSGNGIVSFIFFWNHGGRQIFIKLLFLLVETVFFNFFRHWFKWKQFFGSVRFFFNESFILASGNGFSFNSKSCAFIQRLNWDLLVDTILEIRCKPNFFDFSIPKSGSSFSETDFLSNISFRWAETDFLSSVLLFRATLC